MKKIAIILGGSFGLYNGTGLFREMERELECQIRRVEPNKLETRVGDISLEFYICNSPVRDKNYEAQKKYLETVWKEVMPNPANETVREIQNPSIVLFYGFCGTFKGRKLSYTPELFKEVFFESSKVMEVDHERIKIENPVKIKNILKGKINGATSATVITSNLTLAPVREIPETVSRIIDISRILSQYGDVVEKETYQVVKYFNKKALLGIYLQSSDTLIGKRHMLSEKGLEIDKRKFNKNCVKSLKLAMKTLK